MPPPGAATIRYRFDRFLLDPGSRALSVEGIPIPVSSRGFDILHLLVEQHDRVVGKDEILATVWHGMLVEENNLAVQISALRRSLGEQHGGQPFIATVPGRGYRFVAAIEQDPPGPPAPAAPDPDDTPAPDDAPVQAPRRALPPMSRLWAAAVLALLAGPVWLGTSSHHGPPRLSIVVLPFRNLGPDPAQDYLADAISDDLTTDLSHLPGSRVIARESADTYKGHAVQAQVIGRALDVRYLLEGSLRREGDLLHINAQLIDAHDAAHLWASGFDVAPGELGHARTEIVRHLASALDFTLVQIEAARSLHERASNPDAVDFYLQARSVLDRDDTLAGLIAAQHLLERATAAAPDFADAHAQLGLVLLRKIGDFDDVDEWIDHAQAVGAIDRAIRLSPRDPLAIAARGTLAWEDEQCGAALPMFRLALTLDPDLAQAQSGLAACAHALGHMQEMIDALQDMIRVDPAAAANADRDTLIGFGNLVLDRPDRAGPWLERAAALDVTDAASPLGWQEWNALYRIAAAAECGEKDQASRMYATYAHLWPRRTVWRLASYETRAVAAVGGYRRVLSALRTAGMPSSESETGDAGVAPPFRSRCRRRFRSSPPSRSRHGDDHHDDAAPIAGGRRRATCPGCRARRCRRAERDPGLARRRLGRSGSDAGRCGPRRRSERRPPARRHGRRRVRMDQLQRSASPGGDRARSGALVSRRRGKLGSRRIPRRGSPNAMTRLASRCPATSFFGPSG